MEEEKEEPLVKALVVMTKRCIWGQPIEETTEAEIASDDVGRKRIELVLMMVFLI